MKSDVEQVALALSIEPVAVHIEVAAKMVGLSRRAFYDYFLRPGHLRPVYVGARAMIDVEQLRAAWNVYAADPQNLIRPDRGEQVSSV